MEKESEVEGRRKTHAHLSGVVECDVAGIVVIIVVLVVVLVRVIFQGLVNFFREVGYEAVSRAFLRCFPYCFFFFQVSR